MCKQMLIDTESQLHEHVYELTIIKLFEITDVGIFFMQNKNVVAQKQAQAYFHEASRAFFSLAYHHRALK